MSRASTVARILMGALLLVTGLNGFLHFLPNPPMPPRAQALMTALVESGYFMQLVMVTQVVGGALLLTGVAVPLALVLLAPILVNIVFFHLMLAPEGIVPGLVLCACALVLARAYWPRFRGLFA
jgi:uncharacterized membrane protein YphA (DoxX/SURF4 family)